MTFSDVEDSLAQKEELLKVSAISTLSSTTSTTEYFSAISSDEDDDNFFDIQTDTERESEAEDVKSVPVREDIVEQSVLVQRPILEINKVPAMTRQLMKAR